ncbi:MFS transporter [Sediminibacillus dalangtanensis]|uniref:MFS transporter n=1 Tax=Sediminibacillus dalangtanensis TaxID=2729421 RepID=A0ABX7VX35_9BACI|nr:MFS transporter [Sediminibacillus dalangtanensis]QTM98877.1 MFS transporter [Sediminibacillus dalangtanensis]
MKKGTNKHRSGETSDVGKKQIIGIAFITAASVLGDAMLLIALPIYWKDAGLDSLWQVGVLLSVNRFIRLPVNPLIGLFYQHFHRRTGIMIAVCLAVLTTASYGWMANFWLLLLMRAIWGISWSLLRLGGYLSVIEASNDSNRGQYVGLYNGLWGLGGLTGMLAGGMLIDQTSFLFTSSLFAFIGLLAIPAVYWFIPSNHQESSSKPGAQSAVRKWWSVHTWLVLGTGGVVGIMVFGLFATTLSQLIAGNISTDWSVGGFAVGAATIAGVIQAVRWGWDPFVAPMIGKALTTHRAMVRSLLVVLFSGGFVFLLLGNAASLTILLPALLIFQLISTGFVTTSDTMAASTAAKTDRIKMMTAYTIIVDVGAALGPLISFFLLDITSIALVYTLAGIIFFAVGLCWLIAYATNSSGFKHEG